MISPVTNNWSHEKTSNYFCRNHLPKAKGKSNNNSSGLRRSFLLLPKKVSPLVERRLSYSVSQNHRKNPLESNDSSGCCRIIPLIARSCSCQMRSLLVTSNCCWKHKLLSTRGIIMRQSEESLVLEDKRCGSISESTRVTSMFTYLKTNYWKSHNIL